MKNKLEAYRHADTMGKSPLDLVLMVYDGAIKALKTAGEQFDQKDAQAGYDELQNAKRMITHLYTTLDREKGGQVADQLGKMYTWVLSQLYILEATKSTEQLGKVIQVMSNLRSGWETLKTQTSVASEKAEKNGSGMSDEIAEHVVVTA